MVNTRFQFPSQLLHNIVLPLIQSSRRPFEEAITWAAEFKTQRAVARLYKAGPEAYVLVLGLDKRKTLRHKIVAEELRLQARIMARDAMARKSMQLELPPPHPQTQTYRQGCLMILPPLMVESMPDFLIKAFGLIPKQAAAARALKDHVVTIGGHIIASPLSLSTLISSILMFAPLTREVASHQGQDVSHLASGHHANPCHGLALQAVVGANVTHA